MQGPALECESPSCLASTWNMELCVAASSTAGASWYVAQCMQWRHGGADTQLACINWLWTPRALLERHLSQLGKRHQRVPLGGLLCDAAHVTHRTAPQPRAAFRWAPHRTTPPRRNRMALPRCVSPHYKEIERKCNRIALQPLHIETTPH